MRSITCIVAALMITGTRGLVAQDTASVSASSHDATNNCNSALDDHWLIGGAVGVPGSGRAPAPALFTVGMSMTRLYPGSLGLDLSIGTMPYFVAYGLGAVGARANVVAPVTLGDQVTLLPGAGLSGIGAIAPGGGGGTIGFNTGVSVIVAAGSVALRGGTTFHYFSDSRRPIWLLELGIIPLR